METKSELTESLVPSRPSPRYYGVVKYRPYCTLTDENYVYVGNRVFLAFMYVVIIKAILVFLNTGVRHPSLYVTKCRPQASDAAIVGHTQQVN